MTFSKLTYKTCSVEDCVDSSFKKGMCSTHYHRIRRNGYTELKNRTLRTLPERFWCKVDKSPNEKGCWVWTAATDQRGYGKISYQSKSRRATHIAWFLTFGRFPEKDMLHSCDNPPCVNPAHLRDDSHDVNMREAADRQRLPQGEKRNMAKLKNAEVAEIKTLLSEGAVNSELAKRFNVHKETIRRIKVGEIWQSVPALQRR